MIVDAIIIITLSEFFVYILVNDTFPKSRRKEDDCLQLQVINMNCERSDQCSCPQTTHF